jgi:iron complex outermembrane recepter protein
MGRIRYYGSWTDWTDAFPSTATPGATYPTYNPQVFSAITFADVAFTYALDKNTKVTLGADNLFNTYPDKSHSQAKLKITQASRKWNQKHRLHL